MYSKMDINSVQLLSKQLNEFMCKTNIARVRETWMLAKKSITPKRNSWEKKNNNKQMRIFSGILSVFVCVRVCNLNESIANVRSVYRIAFNQTEKCLLKYKYLSINFQTSGTSRDFLYRIRVFHRGFHFWH